MKNKLKISALTTLILTNFAQASDYASSLLDGIASQNSSYTGTASIAIGSTLQYTNAQGETSATNASAPLAIAIGLGASASKNSTLPADSLRPDNPNFANPLAAIAIGASSVASGYTSTALGYRARALDRASIALGSDAIAAGYASTALGNGALAMTMASTALGNYAYATGFQAVAVGASRHSDGLKATGSQAILLGTADTDGLTQDELLGPDYANGSNPYSSYNKDELSEAITITSESRGAIVSGKNALGVGVAVKALGEQSIAEGYYANASAKDSIAIGSIAKTGKDAIDSITIGSRSNTTGLKSNSLGSVNIVTGNYSTALGNNNVINSNNVMALGNNITVSEGNDWHVILGSGSTVGKINPTTSMTIQGKTYNFAGTTPNSTVSVGSVGGERQIVNVAAGQITETSTDAINGSQLYAVSNAIDKLSTSIKNTQASLTAGSGTTITTTTNSNGTTNYEVAVKVGNGLTIDNNGNIANNLQINNGDNITVTGNAQNGFTISAIDTNTQATVTAGTGITVNQETNTNGTINYIINAKGTKINAGNNVQITGDENNGYTITAISQIINNTNATEIKAGDNINVIGNATDGYIISAKNTQSSTSAGRGIIVTETTNSNGTTNYEVATKVGGGLDIDVNGNIINNLEIKSGDNITITGNAQNGFTISANDTNTQATVTAGAGISVIETQNTNGTTNYEVGVKVGDGLKVGEDGTISTKISGEKGVTVSVINGSTVIGLSDDVIANSVTTGNVSITNEGINAGNSRITNIAPAEVSATSTDAVTGAQLYVVNQHLNNNANNISKLGNRINQLENKIDEVDKQTRRGIAISGAIGMLPQPHISGKSMVSAGVTNYRGEQALAIGYSRLSDNSKHIIKLSGASNMSGKKDMMVGASYGFQW